MKKLVIAALLYAVTAGTAMTPRAAAATPREIVTRNARGPVIVWDATPQIENLISRNIPFDRGVGQLKVHALELFVGAAHGFARKERHLTVMVVYARSGAINARYQTKSFAGIGTAVTLDGSPAIHLNPQWRTQAQHGRFPSGVTLTVSNPASQPESQSGM